MHTQNFSVTGDFYQAFYYKRIYIIYCDTSHILLNILIMLALEKATKEKSYFFFAETDETNIKFFFRECANFLEDKTWEPRAHSEILPV